MTDGVGEREEPDGFYDDDEPGLGCYECDGGWKHGCCDDMCRGCYEAIDCGDAYPCRLCNPRGEMQF